MTHPVQSSLSPREAAIAIWQAGVAAVDSERLVERNVSAWSGGLKLGTTCWPVSRESRICVVGAGKAGAGMAAGFESALGADWLARTSGWVNVPDNCLRTLKRIHLHPARPAGVNEPTEAGVAGSEEILQRVNNLQTHDLCVVLISGGGSALLPAPVEGVSLADKRAVTQLLMRRGAPIQEMNSVRRALSRIKGGGLARECRAGKLVTLIISDVIGDPLETIASGPTVEAPADPGAALEILQRHAGDDVDAIPESVRRVLSRQQVRESSRPTATVTHEIIGNNRTAVEAAARMARQQGFHVLCQEWDHAGIAAEEGDRFAQRLLAAAKDAPAESRVCLVSGGEPTVTLARTNGPQKGGRNQEFALAAARRLLEQSRSGLCVLAGGTDGEDGPTDAAGAVIDAKVIESIRRQGIDVTSYLRVNNSYLVLDQLGALLRTGPTDTNVMDLRIGLMM